MLLSPTASQAEGLVFRIDHTRSKVAAPPGSVETHWPGEDGRDPHVRTQKMGVVMAGLMLARDSRSSPTTEPGSCLYVCVSL